MIYTMMYMNASAELEILRYDAENRMYQFTKAQIPDNMQLDGVNHKNPANNEVFLAYEATETEIAGNALPDIPKKEGARASWLKPIGQFHAAFDERTGQSIEHAYLLIEQMHKDRAIPAFFDNIIKMLKSHGILREDGTQNPDFAGTFTTAEVFQRDGSSRERVLH